MMKVRYFRLTIRIKAQKRRERTPSILAFEAAMP